MAARLTCLVLGHRYRREPMPLAATPREVLMRCVRCGAVRARRPPLGQDSAGALEGPQWRRRDGAG